MGAYQAGVYQCLHEAGLEPEWVSGVSIGAVTAALIALQTHVKIERDAKGKLAWKVEKKPTTVALLRPLVEKLLGFPPANPLGRS